MTSMHEPLSRPCSGKGIVLQLWTHSTSTPIHGACIEQVAFASGGVKKGSLCSQHAGPMSAMYIYRPSVYIARGVNS